MNYLLNAFKTQSSLRAENVQLHQVVKKQTVELEQQLNRERQMNTIVRVFNRSEDFEMLLQDILPMTVALCGGDGGSIDICRWDDSQSDSVKLDNKQVVFSYGYNLPSRLMALRYQAEETDASEGVVNAILDWGIHISGQSVFIPEYRSYPQAKPEWISAGLVGGVMVVPVVAAEKVLGSIAVYSFHSQVHFEEAVLALLEAIGRQAGLVVLNTQLWDEVQHLATVDALTQVFNYRHCLSLAGYELEKITRYGGCFSVMVLQVDHFEKLNETYGRTATNQVLVAAAGICHKSLRRSDVVGRFTEKSFILLLPETDRDNAHFTAERLRKMIAGLIISTDAGDLSITVSSGIASADDETLLSAEKLIEKAELDLQKSTAGG